MKKGLKIFHFIGLFKNKAIEVVREIIDSFVLPEANRKYHPIQSKQTIPENPMITELVFMLTTPNFFVKLAFPEHIPLSDLNQVPKNTIDSPILGNPSIYSDKKVKGLGHEFRALDLLADTLFLLKKQNKNFNIRVPLCSIICYKGMRAIVISHPPINGFETLMVGPDDLGDYRSSQTITQDLMTIANALNLKPHKFEWDPKMRSFPVILSLFTEVHQARLEEWDEFKSMMTVIPAPGENFNSGGISSGGFSSINTQVSLTYQSTIQPSYYLMKLADVFPVDIDINSKDPSHFIKRLRYIRIRIFFFNLFSFCLYLIWVS